MWIGLLMTVVFDIVLAIVIFQVAKNLGASDFAAYMLASLGPVLGMVVGLIRSGKIDGVAIIVLVNLVISAAVALIGSQDIRVQLLKDSVLTGGFGLAILLTSIPVFPKPLMFFFALKFGTDGTKEGVAQWYDLWDRDPSFRRGHRFVNNVWGIGFLIEAGLKAIGTYTLPHGAAFAFNQVAPFALLVILITFSMQYGKKMQRDGARERATAEAART